ncbi:MAG: lysophospholipase [Caldilineales bacterium]|nr:lysophospholipase [Caldilineales bacterium]MCW5860010.1 alpha/beta fold hydrolase [Caldilineales bacterium]
MLPQLSAFQDESHLPFRWDGRANQGRADDGRPRPAALLVHGFPGTPAEMRPLAAAFHDHGWTVQGLLLPGFGPEIATLGERTTADWVAAIHQSLDELRRDHGPLLLVGHSMGGALSIQAAATAAVDGLILLAPFSRLQGILPALWPLIRLVVRQFKPFRLFKPDFRDPKLRAGISEFMGEVDLDDPAVQQAILDFSIPASLIDQLFKAGKSAYALAPQIHAPVLILQGRNDPLARPLQSQRLRQRFAGGASYHELEAAHDLPQPDLPAWPEVRRLTLAFAEELRSAAP